MIKPLLFTAAALGMFTTSLNAAEAPSSISEWASEASKAIEAKMEYPETAIKSVEIDSNKFVLTVNHDGDVLDVEKLNKAEQTYFDQASYDAIRDADLPDLPKSYKKDTATVVLSLDYILKDDDVSKLQKRAMKRVKREKMLAEAKARLSEKDSI
ncbi:TonB C-terminal domain-containing protein [Pseudemcibacter aquimaris]|uniref:TonB C-terminal domain-containing protein n=1 Tax=Pseudemcibacter aquimaris TaxID=2857064 RepID=UPI002013B093|nr:TonB C-terminal domain-containing protein [Pseudemcibacter aquimaris]MCC3862583.1 TonB C-terminal domain-containing protein [Pseudemcibacter aquimaris]WDU57899.1 TonB C-terminal domain-containing protein [Pseudemcibacter aquimaris]